jgi:hypothetical protein
MKPRKIARSFGCPPILWLDDPEKLHHFLGRSADTIERWAQDGLKMHQVNRGGRLYRYIMLDEFIVFLTAIEQTSGTAVSHSARRSA